MGPDEKLKKKGYASGYILGVTLCTCATVAIIAFTIKLLLWLF